MNVQRPDAVVGVDEVAAEALSVLGTGRQVAPFSSRMTSFELPDAYRVTAALNDLRQQRGEQPLGRKIGFTNRTIWAEYNVFAPIWGYVYSSTVFDLADIGESFSLAGLAEPRIEPEVMFRFATSPDPDMDERALLACIDGIAHGFEIVQSIFPGWVFAASDTVAGYGLHGALLVGPWHEISGGREEWLQALSGFEMELRHDGVSVDRGQSEDVLGGPLLALRHLVTLLADDRANPPIAAGEIVTTGTLTRAFPIAAGEAWSTRPLGIPLDGIAVRFT